MALKLTGEEQLDWHKTLGRKGWSVPPWPVEWGGTGWNVTQRFIFDEECYIAGAPPILAFCVLMCGQVLLKYGTEAQKAHFLPRIRDGIDFWVQGYSEPGAGSDLAGLKTMAERRGDKYIVNGQKIWTSLAQHGDWIFCLVRTILQAKQEGISFLLIDLRTPGITIRPIDLMDGNADANEVFFEKREVPAENLVHEENHGWTVAKHLLGHERLNTGRIGSPTLPGHAQGARCHPDRRSWTAPAGHTTLSRPDDPCRGGTDGAGNYQPALSGRRSPGLPPRG